MPAGCYTYKLIMIVGNDHQMNILSCVHINPNYKPVTVIDKLNQTNR